MWGDQFTCLCLCCSPPKGCLRIQSAQRGLELSWTSRGATLYGGPSPSKILSLVSIFGHCLRKHIFLSYTFLSYLGWNSFFLIFCHVKDCLSKTAHPSWRHPWCHIWCHATIYGRAVLPYIWQPIHNLASALFTPSRISFYLLFYSILSYLSWLPN